MTIIHCASYLKGRSIGDPYCDPYGGAGEDFARCKVNHMFHVESTNAWDKVLSVMVLLGGQISSQFSLKVKKL